MEELNQFAISKILGSKIKEIGPVGFGSFNLRPTSEEIQKALANDSDTREPVTFSYEQDAVLVRAFEDVRSGAPTDELLWNGDLANGFVQRCHQLGLKAPDAYLVRRLINVRKNAPRYKKHGIEIRPTSKKKLHPSIVPRYAHVIEFALVKLRYRYGVSIDDILMDPVLTEEFENLATRIASGLTSVDLRLGALYIRKNRVINKQDLDKIRSLDLQVVERAWKGAMSLAKVDAEDVPASPGLIELKEEKRYLYISHNKDIQAAVSQLYTGEAFRLIGSTFWQPKLEAITLFFVPGQKVGDIPIEQWERRLIHDRDPVFNWPMTKKAG